MPQARFDRVKVSANRDGSRSGSELETERMALETLEDAIALAREGHLQSARQLCVVVVFLLQPSIASRPVLLKATLRALLVARGFSLMSRLLVAINGRGVDVTMLPACIGRIEAPRRHEETRRTVLLVDPRWLDQLPPTDPFLDEWCDALIAGVSRGLEQRTRWTESREFART
jgi:hypothetical protein